MAKLKGNYTMGEAIDYFTKGKTTLKLWAVVGTLFPYFPPYYVGFDPRFEEQVPYFFLYLGVYYVLFIALLGNVTDKQSKAKKISAEKAILLGCPIELKSMGGKASNSYRTTVMVNEAMLVKLREQRVEGHVHFEKAEVALAEPFVKKFTIGSGTSARFLSKNIPHYEQARKIGEIPQSPS